MGWKKLRECSDSNLVLRVNLFIWWVRSNIYYQLVLIQLWPVSTASNLIVELSAMMYISVKTEKDLAGHCSGGRTTLSRQMTKTSWVHYQPQNLFHKLQLLKLIQCHRTHNRIRWTKEPKLFFMGY